MKKESIIASVGGILLGVILAIFILLNFKEKEIKENKTISLKITPTVVVMNLKNQTLEINEPATDFITTEKEITIKGRADKDSLIIVTSPYSDKSYKTENDTFSIKFPLSSGENLIKVAAYKDKNTDEKNLKVYQIEE